MQNLFRSKFSSALCVAALSGMMGFSGSANAALFNFSFQNENGAIAGTLSGTITLPDGDGIFAASSVTVNSGPAGLGFTFPVSPAFATFSNTFTVVGGAIDLAGVDFFALYDNSSALALHSFFAGAGGASFSDPLNASSNFGATGVRDADSSTLVFSSAPNNVPEPSSVALLLIGAFGFARSTSRKQSS